jgi:hypothetical protein
LIDGGNKMCGWCAGPDCTKPCKVEICELTKLFGKSKWLFKFVQPERNDAMKLGDRPKTLRRPFNPMSHVGTHAQQSSL